MERIAIEPRMAAMEAVKVQSSSSGVKETKFSSLLSQKSQEDAGTELPAASQKALGLEGKKPEKPKEPETASKDALPAQLMLQLQASAQADPQPEAAERAEAEEALIDGAVLEGVKGPPDGGILVDAEAGTEAPTATGNPLGKAALADASVPAGKDARSGADATVSEGTLAGTEAPAAEDVPAGTKAPAAVEIPVGAEAQEEASVPKGVKPQAAVDQPQAKEPLETSPSTGVEVPVHRSAQSGMDALADAPNQAGEKALMEADGQTAAAPKGMDALRNQGRQAAVRTTGEEAPKSKSADASARQEPPVGEAVLRGAGPQAVTEEVQAGEKFLSRAEVYGEAAQPVQEDKALSKAEEAVEAKFLEASGEEVRSEATMPTAKETEEEGKDMEDAGFGAAQTIEGQAENVSLAKEQEFSVPFTAKAGDAQVVQTTPQTFPQDVGHAIAKRMTGRDNTLTLELEPAALGKMTIRVVYEAGRTAVSILSSNPKTLELLSQSAGEIAQILEEKTGQVTEVYTPPQQQQMDERQPDQGQQSQRQQEGQEERRRNRHTDSFAQQLRLGLV